MKLQLAHDLFLSAIMWMGLFAAAVQAFRITKYFVVLVYYKLRGKEQYAEWKKVCHI